MFDAILNKVNLSDSLIIPKSDYSAITIILKQKFWNWVGTQINLEKMDLSMETDCNVYLVPDIELESSLELKLHVHFKEIFKIELARYIKNDSEFPEINFIEFLQWFEIKSSSHVIDLTGELLDNFDNEDFFDDDLDPKDKNTPPSFNLN
jgi:hypothetical protein